MHYIQVLLVCYFAISSSYSYPVIEDQHGDTFVIVPLHHNIRIRRQTDYSIGSDGASISHQQNLFENDKHKVDGTAFASKPFPGPLSLGGQVDYTHKPTGSGVSVGATNTQGLGTDLKATGNYNFYQSRDGRATAGVSAEYSQHLGGSHGTGSPNYGVFGTLKYNF